MSLAFVPLLLGRGTRLFDHLGDGPVGYRCVEFVGTQAALHARFTRAVD